jgi:UDP-glucose 4-epimerase
LSEQRVLVTGASGFIGANLVRRLLQLGAEVYAQYSSTYQKIENLPIHRRKTDLCDLKSTKTLVRQIEPSVVFHLAAFGVNQTSDIQRAIRVNVVGTANLLQSLLDSRIEQFVHTGTCHEYGEQQGKIRESAPIAPRSVYAATKAASTAICLSFSHQFDFPLAIVRPFVAYGPFANDYTIVSAVILHALRGKDIRLSSGLTKRDFVYVDDVVDAYTKVANKEVSGEIINIGSGIELFIKDVVKQTLDLMKNPIKPLFGALPDRNGEIWHLQADISKAKRIIGWEPKTPLKKGLERTIEWFTTNKQFY